MSELTEAEQNILEAFSVFPYIPLAVATCNEWLLADAGVGEDDDILMGLYEKGWLQFDVEQESYAFHPVFGQFIYDKCKPESQNHLGLMESCRESLEIPESGSALEGQKFIPFAEKMIEKLEIGKDFEQVYFIADIAYFLLYIAEYKKAEELYIRVLHANERVQGEEHPDTAITYNNLAGVYEEQGEYKIALSYCFKAYKVLTLRLGMNHPNTQIVYENMKIIYSGGNPEGNFKQWLEEKMKE